MAKAIWKFPIGGQGFQQQELEQEIEMPEGAIILAVHPQNGQPTIWAKVDPSRQKVKRKVRVIWTGEELSDDFSSKHVHIGTCVFGHVDMVAHVFINAA